MIIKGGLRRWPLMLLGVIPLAALLAGCTQEQTAADPTSTSLTATGTIPTVANDLAKNSAHHTLKVPGETFSLTVDYRTDYDAQAWQTLQPKNINLSLHLGSAAKAGSVPEVLVGSFRSDTTLMAAMPGLDGLPIAVAQDASTSLPGFLISVNYPYDNTITIEGFADSLISRWAVVAGGQPLTEPGLVTAGVYGNQLGFAYRLLVRNTGDPGYHQRIVLDTLTVPEASPAAASAATTSSTAG